MSNPITGLQTAHNYHLPNLIIIGAQKCGTTSLGYYLSLHPEVVMSKIKELNFFVAEQNWPKGLDWYKSNFDGEARVYGEASPNYTFYPIRLGVPERMFAHVPQAKLIYLVRDPLDRIVANYVHRVADGWENASIEHALADFDNNWYIVRSMYYLQTAQFLKFYPWESILIVDQSALHRKRAATLQTIFQFLQIDEKFVSPGFFIQRYRTADKRRLTETGRRIYDGPLTRVLARWPESLSWFIKRTAHWLLSRPVPKPTLSPALRQHLTDYLQPDVDQFRKITNQAFDTWSL